MTLRRLTIFFRFWAEVSHSHLGAQLAGQRVEVHAPQQLADGLGAHADLEARPAVLLVRACGLVHGDAGPSS